MGVFKTIPRRLKEERKTEVIKATLIVTVKMEVCLETFETPQEKLLVIARETIAAGGGEVEFESLEAPEESIEAEKKPKCFGNAAKHDTNTYDCNRCWLEESCKDVICFAEGG